MGRVRRSVLLIFFIGCPALAGPPSRMSRALRSPFLRVILRLCSIEAVSDQGMPDRSHMHTNLMGPPMFDPA
jgi:hypothetical protein